MAALKAGKCLLQVPRSDLGGSTGRFGHGSEFVLGHVFSCPVLLPEEPRIASNPVLTHARDGAYLCTMLVLRTRKAQPDDLPALKDMARRTIRACYASFLGEDGVSGYIDSGESDKEVENGLSNCDVLEVDGQLAAMAVHFDDFIHLMMVDVDAQRKGLGTMLLDHVERELFKSNSTIRLETFEGNTQGINFYMKNDWTEVGRKKDAEHGFVRVFFEKSK